MKKCPRHQAAENKEGVGNSLRVHSHESSEYDGEYDHEAKGERDDPCQTEKGLPIAQLNVLEDKKIKKVERRDIFPHGGFLIFIIAKFTARAQPLYAILFL
jgi:hypothetical protein